MHRSFSDYPEGGTQPASSVLGSSKRSSVLGGAGWGKVDS
jgi:hypothetical protein